MPPEFLLGLRERRRSGTWIAARVSSRIEATPARRLCPGPELALEAAPLGIRGLDDPAAGGRELDDSRPRLRLKPSVRDRHPRRRGDGLDEGRVLQHRLVVDEDGNRLSAVCDGRHRPPRSGAWRLDGTTCVVNVVSFLGQPVAEDERPVAERPPELVPQRSCVGLLPQVDDEIGDDSLRPAAAEQVDEQHHSEGRDHDVVGPE